MKTNLFILLLLCLSNISMAQTKTEKFLINAFGSGQFPVEKLGDERMTDLNTASFIQFEDLGEVGPIAFQIAYSEDIFSGEKKAYMRVRYLDLRNTKLFVGTLSKEEIDKCIKMFKYGKDNLLSKDISTPCNLIYSNESLTRIAFVRSKKDWRVAFTTNLFSPENQCEIVQNDLDSLIELFNNCLNKINQFAN